MEKRNIIVMGASTGGFEAFKRVIADLPPDLEAAIFIVWHMSPTIRGMLPQVFNKINAIHAAHAVDGEPILMNRIYVAPPDHHMLLEHGTVRVTHGPKENRFRPAVDPLFRSAAYAYQNRVIGVVLSGALDDGTAGLWTIKYRGGIAIVQDPKDSQVPSMPESAVSQVSIDFTVPLTEMGSLLSRLASEPAGETKQVTKGEDEKTKAEIRIAAEDITEGIRIMDHGQLSPFTCPDCHGVLTLLKDGDISRFRCHTGHAYSADGLLTAIMEKVEDDLYSAIRGVDESIMLLNHVGDHFAEANHAGLAARYFQQAQKAGQRAELMRQAALLRAQLTMEDMMQLDEEID
ncbi:chemotaxis protein CheB [Dyadobacter sp. CY323]|uniref:chemotaxis protein CheB n=1 Tax=Dyadobacter sp. CY323 TaxID=2907302 RepID=UPI001F2C5AE2|nr:chemotaxis protein CheB [Dyadobacter sp. CY323]MCE6992949.1 chemotaxis protein CheB [Dyadobacter sp. CY323]